MKYVIASSDMANEIYHVLHTAIKTIYPKYYPKEVVDFFCRQHSKEQDLKGPLFQPLTCCLPTISGASARTSRRVWNSKFPENTIPLS